MSTPPTLQSLTARAGRTLRSVRGAFDLPSILVGVLVVAVMALGVMAVVFGVIPYSQDKGAMQDLAAARTAEGVARTKDGRFMAGDNLASAGYLPSSTALAVGADAGGSCWVGFVKSQSGKFFYVTSELNDPRPYTAGTDMGCLTVAEQAALGAEQAPTYLASWGLNSFGQLGNNSTAISWTPVAVTDTGVLAGKTVTALSVGNSHSCVVADGAVYCWGLNSFGQVGNNSTTSSPVPVAVTATGALAGKTVTAISAGYDHTCAVADGAAYCWGSNDYGQLGSNSTTSSPVPVAVTATGVLAGKKISTISAGRNLTCAVADGAAYCWGYNSGGQLGNNSFADSPVPVAVTATGVLAGKTVTAIEAADWHACAVAGGAAYCWGSNGSGQLGNNSFADSPVPVPVTDTGALAGKTVTALSVGNSHSCVVADGAAYCWGGSSSGQVGNNGTTSSPVPVAVTATGVLAGKTVTGLSAGGYHTCAVADGAAYCWGRDSNGQLGNNSFTSSPVPVAVTSTGVLAGKTVTAISAGGDSTVATYR